MEEQQSETIHARIEIIAPPVGMVRCDIEVTNDDDNPATILSRWFGRHIHELLAIAQREHAAMKAAKAPSAIKVPGIKIADAEGKVLN